MKIARKEEEKREIPPEIIVAEIMWRLPVKPLARFRSVCKTWNSIISSDPKFAILQLKNSSTTSCDRQRVMLWDTLDPSSAFLLGKNENRSLTSNNTEFAITKINTNPVEVKCNPFYSIEEVKSEPSYSIEASCDGLVCIRDLMNRSILFWNPLTGETKRVSVPPSGIPTISCWYSYGFGYDSSADDYKLVLIRIGTKDTGLAAPPPNEVVVFSLRTNSWRQIQDFPIMLCHLQVPGVYINGALYWTGYSVDLDRFEVVSLCLEKEKYRLLDIPFADIPFTDFRLHKFHIGVLGHKLVVYYPSNVDGSHHLLLLNPCENSESFTTHAVTLLPNDKSFTPLCLLENVEEVLCLLENVEVSFGVSGCEFGIYRFRDCTFRHLQIIGLPKTFHAMTLSESLISPNTYKGKKN